MPGLSPVRRLTTAARWPVGVGLTSWRYMWRTTPMDRRETAGSVTADAGPDLPVGCDASEVQGADRGVGPLYHRVYSARIRDSPMRAENLMAHLQGNPDVASPREFAQFIKTHPRETGPMHVGDEYLVRMAGPWDGPVRVVRCDPCSFRLVTLRGHLEAGQIEFAVREGEGGIEVRIESWARSGSRLVDLLYTHLRMAKEVQVHMWTSFLERVVELSGGRLDGRLGLETRRVETGEVGRAHLAAA